MGLLSHTRTVRMELRYNTEIIYNLDYLVYLLPIIIMVLAAELIAEKTSTSYVSSCWCSQAQVKYTLCFPSKHKGLFLAPLQYSALFRLIINLKKQFLLDNEQITDCLQSPIFL